MVTTLRAAATSAEFLAGLRFGLVALVIGLLVALAGAQRREGVPVPVAGLLFLVALGVGAQQGLRSLGSPVPAVQPLLLAAAAAVVGAVALADFDTRWGHRGLGPVLLAVSFAGVYTTVPDTELALVALGAALPLALLGWPWPLASLGRLGAASAAGALCWVATIGGVGRGSAVVGGIACLGLMVIEPMARRLQPDRRSVLECLPDGHWGAPLIAAVHLGFVYVAARVAGTRPTVASATVLALVELVAGVSLALVVTAVGTRRGWCSWCTEATCSRRWACRPPERIVQARTTTASRDRTAHR
jgi:hypothetical protein